MALLDTVNIEALLRESSDLELPAVLNHAFNADEAGELVARGLDRLCADDSRMRDRGVRLWVASEADSSGEEHLFANPPGIDESLWAWGARLFPDQKWGLVVNFAERWMPELGHAVEAFTAPLRARVPPPWSSLELVLFAGCYERTPFGLHTDPPNLRTIYLHLGPARKTMFVDMGRDAPARRFAAEAQLSRGAAALELDAGSVMAVPTHHPHVASCEGFNVGVAIAFRRIPRRMLLEAALSTAAEQLENLVRWPSAPADLWGPLPADLDFPELRAARQPVVEWVEEAAGEEALRSLSNGGFSQPPLPLESPAPRRIRLMPGFPLRAFRAEGDIVLFARGNRFTFREVAGAVAWLRALSYDQFHDVARLATSAGLKPRTAEALARLLVEHWAAESDHA